MTFEIVSIPPKDEGYLLELMFCGLLYKGTYQLDTGKELPSFRLCVRQRED